MLVCALGGLFTLRFYIFYMVGAAVGGAFLIGMRPVTSTSLVRQVVIILGVGLALTYVGVMSPARHQLDTINLQSVQASRNDLARSAATGFAQDVDVSTTSGALSAVPVGMIYLLFAPLPWRLRQALPILLFTGMLTVAYSIFQGNVGTAYRQRSQLLVFYFIFVSVGFTLLRERHEERRRRLQEERLARIASARAARAARRALGELRRERDKQWAEVA